jgi:hypothetical protein
MSRNNKTVRNLAIAKKFSELRKNGGGGPAKTQPQHGKKSAWWQKFPSYAAYLAGAKRAAKQDS